MSTYVTVYKANFYAVRSYMKNVRTLHGAVNHAMGCEETGRASASVLFFVEEDPKHEMTWLYVQGDREGGEIERFEKYTVHCLDQRLEELKENDLVEFCLRCSPSRHVRQPGEEKSKRKYITTEQGRCEWLQRQGTRMGFVVQEYHERGKSSIYFRHGELDHEKKDGRKDCYDTYGTMRIEDADAFREAIRNGIGSGKAYGCGMLFTA